MARPFHGKAYRYMTLKDGLQVIGVCEIAGGLWQVCWISQDSRRHQIKSKGLPVMTKPENLQSLLDQWAALHKLEEVKG